LFGIPFGTSLNTLSLVSRVLFSFDDFMLQRSKEFVNTFFHIFIYFLLLFISSTNFYNILSFSSICISNFSS